MMVLSSKAGVSNMWPIGWILPPEGCDPAWKPMALSQLPCHSLRLKIVLIFDIAIVCERMKFEFRCIFKTKKVLFKVETCISTLLGEGGEGFHFRQTSFKCGCVGGGFGINYS